MISSQHGQATGTAMGLVAILLWGSLFAITRSIIEQIGMLWSMAAANLIAGSLGLAIAAAKPGGIGAIGRLPWAYLGGCGLLFVLYNAALFVAIQLAADRLQVVEVGLINYLWPGLTVALAVPILGRRARVTLLPALAVALAGIYIGMTTGKDVSLTTIRAHVLANPLPYALALVAALSWALYSNLARRWAGFSETGGVPAFLLATGGVLTFAAGAFEPFPVDGWTVRGAAELIYLAIFPTLLAYVLWDFGMRKGNVLVVSIASFFTPLISTLVTCLYLNVPMGTRLWAACGLVVVGAVACRYSIHQPQTSQA